MPLSSLRFDNIPQHPAFATGAYRPGFTTVFEVRFPANNAFPEGYGVIWSVCLSGTFLLLVFLTYLLLHPHYISALLDVVAAFLDKLGKATPEHHLRVVARWA